MPRQINLFDELIIDNFAGGGGASTGIELAIGRPVDIAINHDPAAISMHKMNHPYTKHYCESVWDVDPRAVTKGRDVGLAWFSPDCKHFSKAKGGKPVEKKIRGLAWVAIRWVATVKPRVIILENVEEFKTWGPIKDGQPDKKQSARTFNSFVNALKRLGYIVDWKELKACDYGGPTIRKRFFLIARCDGNEIVWPEPSHGPEGLSKKPYRTAAEIIDWTIPTKSIFERKKPLAENTLKRIARGIFKFVINNPEPFIVQVNHGGENFRGQSINEPLQTITAKNGYGVVSPYITRIGQSGFGGDRMQYSLDTPLTTIVTKAEHCLIEPVLIQMCYGERQGQAPRVLDLTKPLGTIPVGGNKFALVNAFISKYYAGGYNGAGAEIIEPLPTVTSVDHNALVTTYVTKFKGNNIGQIVNEPIQTITAGGLHFGEVRAFLIKYYGQGIGQCMEEPLHTVTGRDTFGLVTVAGERYMIADIGLRMLEPKELYNAQGFPPDYIIDVGADGRKLSKAVQVARCGNAVPPAFAEALVRANLPELCGEKLKTMKDLENEMAI